MKEQWSSGRVDWEGTRRSGERGEFSCYVLYERKINKKKEIRINMLKFNRMSHSERSRHNPGKENKIFMGKYLLELM